MKRGIFVITKRFLSLYIIFLVLTSMFSISTVTVEASVDYKDTPTGVGMARHALRAWVEDWQYNYGSCSEGLCDCSGMIVLYHNVGGVRTALLGSSKNAGLANGSMSSIPRVHGLCLAQPNHVGIYLGSTVTMTRARDGATQVTGNAVDQRDEEPDCVLHIAKEKSWQSWCKLVDVAYPTTGWVSFNGDAFYYEKGEYVVSCTKTLKGVKYTFNANGVSNKKPPESEYKATDYEVAKLIKANGSTKVEVSTVSGATLELSEGSTSTNSVYSRADSPFKDGRPLTYDEQKRVDDIIAELNDESNSDKWGAVYTVIAFIGILLIVYSIALLLAFYIDIFNTFTGFSLIGFLSGGKLFAVSSKSEIESLKQMNDSDTLKYISHKEIWLIFTVGIMTSALLLSGKSVFMGIIKLFNWVLSLFGGG